MLYKSDNETGCISIDKAVIRRIAVECIRDLDGKVRLANHKAQTAGFVSKLSGMDESSFITVARNNEGLDIKLNIIIRFGVSINRVTEQLITSIKEKISAMTGIEECGVTVVVVGMMAKQLVRRNIEIKG